MSDPSVTAGPEDSAAVSWEREYWRKQDEFTRETARVSAMLAAVHDMPADLRGSARLTFLTVQAAVRAAAGSRETPSSPPPCTGLLECPAAEHHPMCNAARYPQAKVADDIEGGGE
jgi:hypothetical protein